MIRQYYAQRRRGGVNPLGVGTISVGSAYYLQDEGWWRDRYRGRAVCRTPWVVEGFLNGTMGASHVDARTGKWVSAYWSGRSDMAVVRSMRDRRMVRTVAVRTLQLHEDEGLGRDGCQKYPTLPDMRLYRIMPACELKLAA